MFIVRLVRSRVVEIKLVYVPCDCSRSLAAALRIGPPVCLPTTVPFWKVRKHLKSDRSIENRHSGFLFCLVSYGCFISERTALTVLRGHMFFRLLSFDRQQSVCKSTTCRHFLALSFRRQHENTALFTFMMNCLF